MKQDVSDKKQYKAPCSFCQFVDIFLSVMLFFFSSPKKDWKKTKNNRASWGSVSLSKQARAAAGVASGFLFLQYSFQPKNEY